MLGVLSDEPAWIHLLQVDAGMLRPRASRPIRSLQWAVTNLYVGADGIPMAKTFENVDGRLVTRVTAADAADAPPINGDPSALLDEWQRKLALRFDQRGKVVPVIRAEGAVPSAPSAR